MKRLLTALAFLTATAQAATLAPIQLLNPAGSVSGQAIISTGTSTAPTWGTPGLASVAANTVLGNFSGGAAVSTANAVPSCSTANSALKYTSGTGLSCGTTFALTSGNLSQFAATSSAQLLGVLSDETGSGLAVFATSPSLTTPTIAGAALSGTFSGTPTFSGATTFTSTITPSQTAGIVGTTTNNNANPGSLGEFVSNSASGVSLTSNTNTNITSISLTAGDWDVSGAVEFVAAGSTTIQAITTGVSSTSASFGSVGSLQTIIASFTTGNAQRLEAPVTRFSLSATTTVYLVAVSTFGVSTMTANGLIRARRVR